jgi:gamma-glutamylcyclotransferase (GGCT)/AIG2-like uncharacterized protein YtfP
MNKVFVYGTLKRGLHNHAYIDLSDGEFISDAVSVENRVLYSQHGLPYYQIPAPSDADLVTRKVGGELYEVDHFLQLDSLEGHPHHYTRVRDKFINTTSGEEVEAWVYKQTMYHIPDDSEMLYIYDPNEIV